MPFNRRAGARAGAGPQVKYTAAAVRSSMTALVGRPFEVATRVKRILDRLRVHELLILRIASRLLLELPHLPLACRHILGRAALVDRLRRRRAANRSNAPK